MLTVNEQKNKRLAVGLMSGTSVDGIDAALVELSGSGDALSVKLLAFKNTPYPPAVREKYLSSSSRSGRRWTSLGT